MTYKSFNVFNKKIYIPTNIVNEYNSLCGTLDDKIVAGYADLDDLNENNTKEEIESAIINALTEEIAIYKNPDSIINALSQEGYL